MTVRHLIFGSVLLLLALLCFAWAIVRVAGEYAKRKIRQAVMSELERGRWRMRLG